MERWRVIVDDRSTAPWNMAVDEALFRSFGPEDFPILRIYRWEPALSFGRFSPVRKLLDLPLIKRKKISYARRITGGGVLVHGGDISYSLIVPASLTRELGVKGSYRHLCRFLIRFYERLGLEAVFAAQAGLREQRSDICLAGHESYDIVVDGIKIGGNAQRHGREAMLQHGSIPIRIEQDTFEPLFLEESGLAHAASLQNLGIGLSEEVLISTLKEAFCETFDAAVVEEGLRPCEETAARALYAGKYMKESWNIDAREPL